MIHNQQLEQNVIGAILCLNGYGESVQSVLDLLRVEDFYGVNHKAIYLAMLDSNQKGICPDANTVAWHHIVESEGVNPMYVMELWKNTVSGINILKHAESLKKISELRITQDKMNAINEIISSSGDIDEKLKEIDQIFSLEVGFTDNNVGARHISECMPIYIDRLEKRWENPDSVVFSTGIVDLDKILGGGFEIGLYAIGANPKMGKTELMGKIINHFGVDKKLPVYVGSLEMPDFQVIERLVSSYGKLDKTALKNNFKGDNDFAVLHSMHQRACGEVGFSDIYIDDRHENTVKKIRRECLRIKKKHGRIGGIFVDYLTLLNSDTKHDRNDLAVAAMTRALKGMSKEFLCPVVMLLQLNRGNTNRTDKRPLASDSRESGAIEQDVDGWIGLYRDSAFDENSKWKNITEIIVRLNRHGETGTCYQVLTGHGFEDADEHTVAKLLHDEETKRPIKAAATENF